MSYKITADNYDPVFCTPYENEYKDGYNPVAYVLRYTVTIASDLSLASMGIWMFPTKMHLSLWS